MLRFVLIVLSNHWVDHTPQWCTYSYRRQLQFGGGVTLEQCKQLCPRCAAIEYWSGNTKVCYECLDHTKRTSFTNTNDGGYPPHVYIRQWTTSSSSFVAVFLLTCVHISRIESLHLVFLDSGLHDHFQRWSISPPLMSPGSNWGFQLQKDPLDKVVNNILAPSGRSYRAVIPAMALK